MFPFDNKASDYIREKTLILNTFLLLLFFIIFTFISVIFFVNSNG